MNTPRNIIGIDRIQAREFSGLQRLGNSVVHISSTTAWKSTPIQVPAKLTISDKIEDGVRIYTAQLVFRTCEEMDECSRLAYRCKTADGKYYLIGTDDRPYTITTVSRPHPDNVTDSQLNEVTVNYSSNYKIPYIL